MDHGGLNTQKVIEVLIGHKGLDARHMDKSFNKSGKTGYWCEMRSPNRLREIRYLVMIKSW